MEGANKNRTRINYLRKFRRARGLKAKDVAAILGLRSSSTLSRWENGVTLPDSLNLLRLAALYRTFVDALFPEVACDLKSEVQARETERLESRLLSDDPRRIDIESMGIRSSIDSISKREAA